VKASVISLRSWVARDRRAKCGSEVDARWRISFINLGRRGHCYRLDLCVPGGMTSPALENS
jgi:hypothetical protein